MTLGTTRHRTCFKFIPVCAIDAGISSNNTVGTIALKGHCHDSSGMITSAEPKPVRPKTQYPSNTTSAGYPKSFSKAASNMSPQYAAGVLIQSTTAGLLLELKQRWDPSRGRAKLSPSCKMNASPSK